MDMDFAMLFFGNCILYAAGDGVSLLFANVEPCDEDVRIVYIGACLCVGLLLKVVTCRLST